MNRQQFEHFLYFPGELSSARLADLDELVRSFPYCQTLYLMLAKTHSSDDSVYDQHHLRLAAAHATDRKRLRELIMESTPLVASPETPCELTEEPSLLPDTDQVDFDHFRQLIAELEHTITERNIQREKPRLYDIEKEFEDLEKQPAGISSTEPGHMEDTPAGRNDGDEVRMQSPKPSFFDPVDTARKSILEHDDLATETLAQIYAGQGHFHRAIKIYQQLMLKFPEKSRYFAAQIEKLKL